MSPVIIENKSRLMCTCAIEEVGSLQDHVSVIGVIPEHEGLPGRVHLLVLHHIQPLGVVPAELLTLDPFAPLLVTLLDGWGGGGHCSGR